nr:hypothetical protein [uncultured Chitinophaga sp.]
MKKCYMCEETAENREHVPAKTFFPTGYRNNLITVHSCEKHNNATSMDDEYVRGVVVTCIDNNEVANEHWHRAVKKTFLHSPLLFFETFAQKDNKAFVHDRDRIDKVMKKIAHGLYYHEFKSHWPGNPKPFYENLLFEDGQKDVDVRLAGVNKIPWTSSYKGANPLVFKYQFLFGLINGNDNYALKMIFYEGFTVYIIPNL